jgi:hypothetical protein
LNVNRVLSVDEMANLTLHGASNSDHEGI